MPEKITVLRVGAKRNGYRRAGLLFGETAASIPVSSLTNHQIKELQHDRMLSVEKVDVVVVDESELAALRTKAALVDALVAALPENSIVVTDPESAVGTVADVLAKAEVGSRLMGVIPSDFTWTESPVEYVANLREQQRVQTERANELQAKLDAKAATKDAGTHKHTGSR